MSLSGLRRELSDLKREYAPNFRTIEELQKCDIRALTNEELFRLIQIHFPGFKSLEELTVDTLEKLCKGEF
jgi:hypothetical protein